MSSDHNVRCPLCHGTGHVPAMVGLAYEGSMSTWVERHRREEEREEARQAQRDQAADDHRDP